MNWVRYSFAIFISVMLALFILAYITSILGIARVIKKMLHGQKISPARLLAQPLNSNVNHHKRHRRYLWNCPPCAR